MRRFRSDRRTRPLLLLALALAIQVKGVASAPTEGTNTPTGETPLLTAAYQGDLPLVRRLLTEGAAQTTNRYGASPLSCACLHGNVLLARLLLESGADPNTIGPGGAPVLLLAARSGQAEIVRDLLDRGAHAGATEPARQQTALVWAAAEGQADVVKLLLTRGADLEAQSSGRYNALHFAARQGQLDVARLLLSHGAQRDVGSGDDGAGPSALGLAVINLHYELAGALLDAGADPNYTWKGRTVLHALTWVSRLGTGTNEPPPEGSGRWDRLQLLQSLASHGGDVNRRMTERRAGLRTVLNMRGATPFLLAARTGDAAMMRLLVKLGADPLIPNEDGTTPLLVAAGVGVQSPEEDPGTVDEALECVKVAVEAGNDVNAVDSRGETAMHGAAYKYAAGVVPYLMEHGARVEIWNRKNHHGWTPLRIATGVHRAMNLRSSPATAAELRKFMLAAQVSIELEPETNISGATK